MRAHAAIITLTPLAHCATITKSSWDSPPSLGAMCLLRWAALGSGGFRSGLGVNQLASILSPVQRSLMERVREVICAPARSDVDTSVPAEPPSVFPLDDPAREAGVQSAR